MQKKLAFFALLAASAASADVITVKSPDGRNELALDTGAPFTVQVKRDGRALCAPSPISLTVKGRAPLGGAAESPKSVEDSTRAGRLRTPIYKRGEIDEAAEVRQVGFGDWSIELLARNDGVAYRWITEFHGRTTVMDERLDVTALSPDETVYSQYGNGAFRDDPFQNSWEHPAYQYKVSELTTSEKELVQAPVVFPSKGAAMAVTESDLRDYAGLSFRRAPSDPAVLRAVFAKAPAEVCGGDFGRPLVEKGERARYVRVTRRADHVAETEGTRSFPWRTFLLADTPAKLVESDIVYALAKPNALGDTSWVKPGKVAWDWWNAMNLSGTGERLVGTKAYEYFIDFAARNAIEYVIFDEGWSRGLDIFTYSDEYDVQGLIDRANSKGVGIVLWMAWAQIEGREEKVAAHFAKRGVKGFKVDFIDRDDVDAVRFYERLAQACAKHRLILDLHGACKPTGLQRTYPNILNYEGVYGLEQSKWPQAHDLVADEATVPFVRMLAGPMDFTPGAMRNFPRDNYQPCFFRPGVVGTRVRQMALVSLYEAPLQMLCDSPTTYERNFECFRFMAQIPTVWDDQVVLGGEFGNWIAIARRKGGVWYLSAINEWKCGANGAGQEITVDLGFLGGGEWAVDSFEDGPNADRDPEEYVRRRRTVKAGTPFVLKLMDGGGFTARFTQDNAKGRNDAQGKE